ncbi:AraC family transcriptional regulator [Magnetospirillum fulvum]|uniref:Transcriptional regulator, AraC family n=1 Tax=Magnetospirillum fulvum TaxID=1082 RepID=A0A1H6HND7_MAGFU|nr:AraC family transcriptional regulator [Magnetospirillum fulvum]SEH35493.1 transcriptional regulator, AraC family [Magnetospirillum fulvum]
MTATLVDLAELVDRHWRAHGRETPLDGLLLTRADRPSGVIRSVYRPSFCVVVQGGKTTMLGDRSFRYRAGQGLLASMDLPVTARITEASAAEPYLALSLAIDPATVAALLSAQAEVLPPPPFEPLRVVSLDPDLCDPLARLLSLLAIPRDLAVLAPLIRQEITWRLLSGPLGVTLRQIGLADGHAARIQRVTAFIRSHYAEPLRVADLAALAAMSVPSFHRHFKAVTTMTPVQFQKQVRLQEARRRLVNAEDVAGVGYAIGYESPSQFSRDYRRLFGTSPGRDGVALRAALASEPLLP